NVVALAAKAGYSTWWISNQGKLGEHDTRISVIASDADGFAPIFPDTCYHLTHYWPAAADIPVASDNPVHYADA
ncbi:hypothetical protein, partial [Escherichia coli]|uniref:hypothetical protein n=1 Tax=Escherichia coli TaxID=562 RepID=UPI0021B237C9